MPLLRNNNQSLSTSPMMRDSLSSKASPFYTRLAETAPALLLGADMPTHSCWAFVPPHVKLEHFALFFSNSQSKSFSSFGRMPIVHLTLKIGLCCFLLRQQLVKLSCIMRTCQRDTTLYKGMMWNPNCSLQLPHLSCTQIASRFLCFVCAWHSSELGVIGGKDGVHDSLQPWKKQSCVELVLRKA